MSVIHKLKPILFPVRIEEAKSKHGYAFNPNISHQVVGKFDDKDLVVNSCSKGYTLVDNRELILPLLQKLEEKYKVDVIVKHYKHSKFYVDFLIKDFFIKVLDKDYLYPRLRVVNSYDGSITFRFNMGFYRIFCENMINVEAEILDLDEEDLEEFENFAIRHTVSVKEAITRAVKSIDAFIDFAPKLKTVYKQMTKKVYKAPQERLIEVAERVKYPPKSLEFATAQLTKELEQFPACDYIIYNCLNYGLYSNPKSQMKDHKKDKIDLRVLNFLLTYNKN